MKLLRASIEHFGCIRKAVLELGPGLNVLYGPNDLGKSTLARAVRAALLIQHSSNAADAFVEWDSDERPTVSVAFESPDRRVWRIDKRFGSNGSSVLLESKDGQSFVVVKKAREVDEEVRNLLGWGIASPATKAAPRGLPASFLATVLLGEQTDVARVLSQTLDADTDASGRERITTALEAFAQDPEFKRILAEAQRKVDEAFTGRGARRKDRSSPFRDATEEVKNIQRDLETLRRRVGESEDARHRLEAGHAEHERRGAARLDALARREGLRSARAQLEARRSAAAELAAAEQEFARRKGELDALADRVAKLGEAEARLGALRQDRDSLEVEREAASGRLELAHEALLRARSDEVQRERALRLAALGTRRLELEARATALGSRREETRKARAVESRIEESQARLGRMTSEREGLDARAARAKERSELAVRRSASLEVASRLLARARTQREIAELEGVRSIAEAETLQAKTLRARADGLEVERDRRLPDEAELERLRQLAQELEVAEASLGGGISIAIERLRAVDLSAIVDGRESDVPAQGTVHIEAGRSVRLQIGKSAIVTVTSGERDVRDRAERLRVRWASEAAPALERAGASDLPALAERVGADAALRRAIEGARQEATALEARAALGEGRLGRLEELRGELARTERELAGDGVEEAEKILAELGSRSLEGYRIELGRDRDQAAEAATRMSEALRESSVERGVLEERIASDRRALAELRTPRPADGWGPEEMRLEADLARVEVEQAGVARELTTVSAERDVEERQSEAALQEAARVVAALDARRKTLASGLETQQQETSRIAGEVETRKERAATIDLAGARGRVEEWSARLRALPAPGSDVEDRTILEAERAVETAELEHQRSQDEVRKAEGALQTVGGQVVVEEERAAKEALRLAEQKERDLELDYDAYKLLVETLREAENAEGQHLGEALSVAVSDRLGQLTGGRYSKLEVAPNLLAGRVQSRGAAREIACLSVGTQEQLATLLRLTVAEHLGCMLVLDDHLTQADATRGAWFRQILREHAAKAQVVVLTCHPLDYLRPEDLPEDGAASASRAGGLVRAIDASRVIERS